MTAQRRMIDRTQECFGIEPHIPVFEKSGREDGSFERAYCTYDRDDDNYICPGGNGLRRSNRNFGTPRTGIDKDCFIRYRARQHDCEGCALRQQCTPNAPAR